MTSGVPEAERLARRPENPSRAVPVVEFYPDQRKVRVLDIMLDVLPLPDDVNARRFIPKWETLKSQTCWDGPTVMLIRDLAIRLAGGTPSRLEGPTGVSKSFGLEVIAALTNRGLLRHNYSKDSDPGDTIGRFVPSDNQIAVRFEELLADPEITDEAKTIIQNAQTQSRPLSIYESRKVAAILGLGDLDDKKQWRWKNGTLAGSMMYGSIFGADEVNLAPGNVVERENSAIERRGLLRLVEHEGEVIRPLTPDEQAIVDDGGVIPGVIGLHQNFWYVAAQNPYGIGGGRIEESEARRNRLQDRIVEKLSTKEYEDFLRFEINGNHPDIVWQGKRYKGEKGATTQFRDLENIPHVDALITWIASFQSDLEQLVEQGKIGSEKDIKGGSYVYARRNLLRFLDSIKAAQKALVDTDELFKTGKLTYNTNWHDVVMEAVRQEYIVGMYKEDAEVIQELIKASGIEDYLGESKNNPTMPSWAIRAQQQGFSIEGGQGTWVLSKVDLTGYSISTEELIQQAQEEGYATEEDDDRLKIERPLQSVLSLFVQREQELTKRNPTKDVEGPNEEVKYDN